LSIPPLDKAIFDATLVIAIVYNVLIMN